MSARTRACRAAVAITLALVGCDSASAVLDRIDGGTGADAAPPDGDGGTFLPIRPVRTFLRRQLDDAYLSEGAGILDVNGDGALDFATDQSWYEGPSLSEHPIRPREEYAPRREFAEGYGAYGMDVDRDGCTDIVAPARPLDPEHWYEHPCTGGTPSGTSGTWERHVLVDAGFEGVENPILVDLFRDGRPVLLASDGREGFWQFGWLEPGSDPRARWEWRAIGPSALAIANPFSHGIGAGDVDGDGDLDFLTVSGWLERTGDRTSWTPHLEPGTFPSPSDVELRAMCTRMETYDVNGDGLADVICARPHGRGLYWLEQRAGAARTFVEHAIDLTISEMHAIRLADLDADGVPEIVSGTRWCSLCLAPAPSDPDGVDDATPYLVYYALSRDAAGPHFTRNVIDTSIGIGAAFDVGDVTADGRPDIVVANKHGVAVFEQIP